jgi:hypothetical protein
MTYTAQWMPNNSYIIGDREYGYELCCIKLYENLINLLTDYEIDALIETIVDIVSKAVESAETEQESTK